jgi:ribose transport system substrate-binding protein
MTQHEYTARDRQPPDVGCYYFIIKPLVVFVIALTISGCGRQNALNTQPAAGSAPQNKGVIALSVLTLANPFFKEIADTMTEEAAKHGYEVLTVSGEFDAARQQNQVKDFIVRKVSAIVLTPCDSKAIGPAIQEATAAGIPVFTADIACLAPGAKVVTHIATDNYGGGKEAAKAMIEALGEAGGKVGILHHAPVESCILRVKGFREVIEQYNAVRTSGRIQIVAELPGGGVKDQGFRAAQDLLQAHSDLNGIFAINDPSALGARAAVEKAGKESQVRIIGFDGQPEGKQAIKDGKIYADPIQFPDQIGRKTVDAIVKHFAGEPLPNEILIPTALYRKADAEKDPKL